MRKVILTLLVAIAFVLNAAAQDRTVTGRITDEKGAPVQGVSVTSSDNKNGTSTDKDGNYTIKVASNAKTLTFTSVNFATVSRPIGTANVITLSLASSVQGLDEVIIVGYGTQQKKAFTGSAAKVNAGAIAQLITPAFDKDLAGRASGVNVVNSSGTVNAPARIRIRGLNSVSGNLSPLIVVDGIPITTGNLALIGNSNALGDINPSDIESFEVLKDGSATAIYGSRAAGGIIQITTKKGGKGKSLVSYDATIGFSNPSKKFSLLNASQFATIANEKLINSGALPAAINAPGINTDWQDYVFTKNAFTQNQTLGISGGSDKTNFYFSFNYSSNQGTIITNKNKSIRVRSNVEHQATKWLKVGNLMTLSRQTDNDQNNTANALSGSIAGAIRALPNVNILDATNPTGFNIQPYPANVLGQGSNLRPVDDAYTNQGFVLANNRYESEKYRIINNGYIEISPVKGLKYRSQFGVDYFNDNSLQILDGRHGDGFSTTVPGFIYNGQQNILQTTIQNYINYNHSFRAHNVFLTVGHELQETKSRFFSASGNNISDPYYLKENVISNTVGGTQTVGGNFAKYVLESFFGRVNYDYKNKYFLQASYRRDGQSSLAKGLKYQNFPGASIGWRPLAEKFVSSSRFISKNITDLKIRASYAEVGNPIGGFPAYSLYGARPYGNIGGIAVSSVGNVLLSGERSVKYDLGIDFTIRNNVNFTVDLYKNDNNDLIFQVPTPFSAGIPLNQIPQNIGKVENKGIELNIDFNLVRTKSFTWNVNANYSYISNKIKKLYPLGGVDQKEVNVGNYNINRVGESIGAIYGYRFAGVNTGNGNPVYYNAANQLVQRNIADAGYYLANSLSDPTLGASSPLVSTDKVILGNSLPKYYGGFTNTFNYKGFGLQVFFRYQGGNKIMNITRQEILLNQRFANSGTELLNRWTTPGQITDVPKLYYGLDANVNQNGDAISRFVENGNFLKLQTITFSYQFNSESLQAMTKGAFKSARFFIQMQNVQTWTKYSGIDPEAYSELGLDNGLSPQIRTISTGVNLSF